MSTISWKYTLTRAKSRLRWLVELWMSFDTLFRRSCRAQMSLSRQQHAAQVEVAGLALRSVGTPVLRACQRQRAWRQ